MSKDELNEWKFDVHVIPGSTSPMDSDAQMETAFSLVERGGVPVPPEYFVELSRLPGLFSAMSEQMVQADEEVPSGEEEPIETQPEEEMVDMEIPPEEQAALDFAAQEGMAPDVPMPPPELPMAQ
jgi:hypothetical protein